MDQSSKQVPENNDDVDVVVIVQLHPPEDLQTLQQKQRQTSLEFGWLSVEMLQIIFGMVGIQNRRSLTQVCHYLNQMVHGYESVHNPKCVYCEEYMRVPRRIYLHTVLQTTTPITSGYFAIAISYFSQPCSNDLEALAKKRIETPNNGDEVLCSSSSSLLRLHAHSDCARVVAAFERFIVASIAAGSQHGSSNNNNSGESLFYTLKLAGSLRDCKFETLTSECTLKLRHRLITDLCNYSQRYSQMLLSDTVVDKQEKRGRRNDMELLLAITHKHVPAEEQQQQHMCRDGDLLCTQKLCEETIEKIYSSAPWIRFRVHLFKLALIEHYFTTQHIPADLKCEMLPLVITIPEHRNVSTEYADAVFSLLECMVLQQVAYNSQQRFHTGSDDVNLAMGSTNRFLSEVQARRRIHELTTDKQKLTAAAIEESLMLAPRCFSCDSRIALVDVRDYSSKTISSLSVKPLAEIYCILLRPRDRYLRCCLWRRVPTNFAAGVLNNDDDNHVFTARNEGAFKPGYILWTAEKDELRLPISSSSSFSSSSPSSTDNVPTYKMEQLAYCICFDCMKGVSMPLASSSKVGQSLCMVLNGVKLPHGTIHSLQHTLELAQYIFKPYNLIKDLYSAWKQQFPNRPHCPLIPILKKQ